MVRARGEARRVRDPAGEAEYSADHRADDADHGAVGEHHQADRAVGSAQRGEHAERAQPALGQHGEAGHRDQPDEHQPEDRERQHDVCRIKTVGRLRGLRSHTLREGERDQTLVRRVEQHAHPVRLIELTRRH